MAIVAQDTAQALVQNTITLFTPAQKIDQVVASVRDLHCNLIPNKAIFQGTLHKQIFFVNLEGTVVHQGLDIPFSGFLDLPGILPGQCCQPTANVVFVEDTLLSPERLQETAVVDVNVQVRDDLPMSCCACANMQENIHIFPGCQRAFSKKESGTSSLSFRASQCRFK
ncbi:MAG TPA: DUF3794 domain-containing protein [Bacillota bacterium]|jgi:hypothetical protein|nr:DUF3794 domain-containing protein [Bacillota bacterium]